MRVLEWGGESIVEIILREPKGWFSELLHQFILHKEKTEKSHKISGRWENQYLEIEKVPSARIPMRFARNLAKDELGISSIILFESPPNTPNAYRPFWFNVASHGEMTGLHDHANLAALSGVTYLQASENCGDLYFRKEGIADLVVKPEVGKLVVFPPCLRHGVDSNESGEDRISFAFNLFPFPLVQYKL